MNATYVIVGIIVGAAILAIVTKSARLQGDWQVQGAAMSFAENFDGDREPAEDDSDEHAEHMTAGDAVGKAKHAAATTADKAAAGLTPEQHAEMAALKEKLAKHTEHAAHEAGVEGFEAAEMPFLGTEYAPVSDAL